MANTTTFETIFEKVMQDRLDEPQNWKEVCNVEMSNTRVISTSYISTAGGWAADAALTRGTAFDPTDVAQTAETLTISTGRHVTTYFDFGDLAQSPWTTEEEIYARAGARLGERIEAAVLARHGSWRNIGLVAGVWTDNDGTAGAVSASNVDDLARLLRRVVREQNGQDLLLKNGIGAVLDPISFEPLEAFAAANGFESADQALQKGLAPQVHYLGITWYVSNQNAADHAFAGIRKAERLGILKGTFGKMHKFPGIGSDGGAAGEGIQSGISYHTRVDYGHLTKHIWGQVKLLLIKAKVQRWITHTKQAIAVQVKRLSEEASIFWRCNSLTYGYI